LDRTAEAMARAERLGDPVQLLLASLWRGYIATRAGHIDEADRCLAVAQTLAEQLDQPTFHWMCAAHAARRALWAGDSDRAEQLATRALATGTESAQPDAALVFGSQIMQANWQRGTLPVLIPIIEQAVADNLGIPAFIPALAVALAEAGDVDAARHMLDEFAATGFDLPIDEVWLTGMCLWAEVAIECRDSTHAGPILDLLAPWADQVACNEAPVQGPVSHLLGGLAAILGRHDDADGYFAQSVAMNERTGAKFFGALTDLEWGRMLAARDRPGDRRKARDLLARSRATADAHRYALVARHAADALRQLD
jgi:ATP/maltotriose-dependent transcriptional regulator MalT